jgi:hypothetical protein
MKKINMIISILGLLFASVSYGSTYAGISFGETDLDVKGVDDTSGTSLFLGHNLTSNLAIELSVNDWGSSSDSLFKEEYDSVDFGFVVKNNITENVDLLAGIGIASWDLDGIDKFDGTSYGVSSSDLYYSLGFGFKVSEANMRFIYKRYDLNYDGASLDPYNLSIGAFINF